MPRPDTPETAHGKELAAEMRRLSRVPKTELEVRRRLEKKGLAADMIDGLVDELKSARFIDDARLADSFARSRLEKSMGPERIRRELGERGIPESTIDKAIAAAELDFDRNDVLRKTVAKRLRTHGEPSTARELKSLCDFLARRGFDPEAVRAELDGYFQTIMQRGG